MARTPQQTLTLLRSVVAMVNRVADVAEPLGKQAEHVEQQMGGLQLQRRAFRPLRVAGRRGRHCSVA
jgi:hypothetical protein